MLAQFTPTPRIRRSPFFDATVADGVASFSVYNHMYMPTGFGDPAGDTIGIAALRRIRAAGPRRHQLGIALDHPEPLAQQDRRRAVFSGATMAGRMTANAWPPRLGRNIGLTLVSTAAGPGDRVTVALDDGRRVAGELPDLPFLWGRPPQLAPRQPPRQPLHARPCSRKPIPPATPRRRCRLRSPGAGPSPSSRTRMPARPR